ncbi:hypothetical protein D0T49_03350 [Paludibacter sp. 221]|uniref:hypothetical protein n=1 Tax=Paludibacter sp. 221 TaxID=2302939 RepID=UPI0013D0C628|nr:hypothetical protein [Paludibacter sp. 221]NDV46076.1 hypothetical protein [Paludibacter sp. 221]
MKKTLLLLISIFAFISINAQTIAIDGSKTDWANVPILSEPGVYPYVKVYTDGDNVYYMMELTSGEAFNDTKYDALRAYIDADRDETTGQKSSWLHINAGNDYDITSVISPWNGSSMFWSDQSIQRSYNESFAEAGFTKIQMANSYEAGFTGTKIPLADNFGISISYKTGEAEAVYSPANNYDFA